MTDPTTPERDKAYGVFKPVGHVVVSFPPQVDLGRATMAMADAGFSSDRIERYDAERMRRQAEGDIAHASGLASIGQELNLVKAHLELARQGYGFLVVQASGDTEAQRVAEVAGRLGATRAQRYGRLMIEELIEVGDGLPQVAESPDRGLDAQTERGEQT